MRHVAPTRAESFGRLPDGQSASLHTLQNEHLRVSITDYGGRMVSIEAPDKSGRPADVLLGFDDAAAYVKAGGAFGALLGRNANRIADGCFTLEGHEYHLATNDGTSTLHGGPVGFDKALWRVVSTSNRSRACSLVLAHVSPDGDQRFPGELSVEATYRLDGESLWLILEAQTTKPTPVSLSAHPYFNLAGTEQGDILDHIVHLPHRPRGGSFVSSRLQWPLPDRISMSRSLGSTSLLIFVGRRFNVSMR